MLCKVLRIIHVSLGRQAPTHTHSDNERRGRNNDILLSEAGKSPSLMPNEISIFWVKYKSCHPADSLLLLVAYAPIRSFGRRPM